jgi:predicted DNA-binding transcriptional regulator YafY
LELGLHLSGGFRRANNLDRGRASGRRKHTIHIAFDSFAAPLVQERQWHPSQKITQLRDGGIELSLTLGNLEEVERWILSWGRHAQVLAPLELKKRIANTVWALADSYGKAP